MDVHQIGKTDETYKNDIGIWYHRELLYIQQYTMDFYWERFIWFLCKCAVWCSRRVVCFNVSMLLCMRVNYRISERSKSMWFVCSYKRHDKTRSMVNNENGKQQWKYTLTFFHIENNIIFAFFCRCCCFFFYFIHF